MERVGPAALLVRSLREATSICRRAKKLPHLDLVDRNGSWGSAKLGNTRWPQYFLRYSLRPFSNSSNSHVFRAQETGRGTRR